MLFGSLIGCKVVNSNGCLAEFDGCAPHAVTPFQGQRQSSIAFCPRGIMDLQLEKPDQWRRLDEESDFRLPNEEYSVNYVLVSMLYAILSRSCGQRQP